MKIFFMSGDCRKADEVSQILQPRGYQIHHIEKRIEELQTPSLRKLVRHKVLEAFKKLRRPVMVEHTALYLQSLNGLPGGLTQIFWKNLGSEKFVKIFGAQEETGLLACTMVGYCDGRKIVRAMGAIRGRIAPEPRGSDDFGWDCVFIPEGSTETFAEMGSRKDEISMRRKALDVLVRKLEAAGTWKA